jgi:hypothetical protein
MRDGVRLAATIYGTSYSGFIRSFSVERPALREPHETGSLLI